MNAIRMLTHNIAHGDAAAEKSKLVKKSYASFPKGHVNDDGLGDRAKFSAMKKFSTIKCDDYFSEWGMQNKKIELDMSHDVLVDDAVDFFKMPEINNGPPTKDPLYYENKMNLTTTKNDFIRKRMAQDAIIAQVNGSAVESKNGEYEEGGDSFDADDKVGTHKKILGAKQTRHVFIKAIASAGDDDKSTSSKSLLSRAKSTSSIAPSSTDDDSSVLMSSTVSSIADNNIMRALKADKVAYLIEKGYLKIDIPHRMKRIANDDPGESIDGILEEYLKDNAERNSKKREDKKDA